LLYVFTQKEAYGKYGDTCAILVVLFLVTLWINMNVLCIFWFQIVVFELFTAGTHIVFADTPILSPVFDKWYVSAIENECVSRYVYSITSNKCMYIWHGFWGFHNDCCSNDIFIWVFTPWIKVCSNILEAFCGSLSEWLNVVEMDAKVIGNHTQSPWRWRQYFLYQLWNRHLLHHVKGHGTLRLTLTDWT